MSLSDGIAVVDNHNRLAFINSAAEKILGQSNDDVAGSELGDFLDMKVLPDLTEEEHDSHEMEIEIDGKEKTFELRLSRLSNAQKEPLGWLIVFRDISDRKKLENELRCLATTDSLTGVYNRRHFIYRGMDEVKRCLRYHKHMSVLMLDIDHFKRINDEFGHHTGDLVLQAFTRVCTGILRNFDTFGRLGGEEFAVIMPETDIQKAAIVAERLRRTIMEMQVAAEDQTVKLTVSIGIAPLDNRHQDMESIMKSADRALYRAKNSGRNRVAQVV
jgi:diguanylate cyclase (GGDEF)-like protein/PAS domain S-box-containing protein